MRKILMLSGLLFFTSCATDNYIIKKTLTSPNEKYVAVVFLGDQGTLSSYLPKVSIYRKNEKIRYGSKNLKHFSAIVQNMLMRFGKMSQR
jgi:hypothetical protein